MFSVTFKMLVYLLYKKQKKKNLLGQISTYSHIFRKCKVVIPKGWAGLYGGMKSWQKVFKSLAASEPFHPYLRGVRVRGKGDGYFHRGEFLKLIIFFKIQKNRI